MKILSIYNIKGGVGKTAAAVNLSYLSAREGYRTLVWDLDPQAAATYYFRIRPNVKGGGKKLLKGKTEVDDHIKGTDFENLELLPADFSYRNMDLALGDSKKPAEQLLRLLSPLSYEYDHLILDCPPSISLVSENVFRAADGLIVPTIPTTLSVRTYEQLKDFFQGHNLQNINVLPFFSMVDRRKKMHLKVMEELPQRFPETLESVIPYASDVERMGVYRAPLNAYDTHAPAALAYERLWAEIKARVGI